MSLSIIIADYAGCVHCLCTFVFLYVHVSVHAQYVCVCHDCRRTLLLVYVFFMYVCMYAGLSALVIVCLCLIAIVIRNIRSLIQRNSLQSIWKFRCMLSGYRLKPCFFFPYFCLSAFLPPMLLRDLNFIPVSSRQPNPAN